MGMPALQHAAPSTTATRPRLRVVKPNTRHATPSRSPRTKVNVGRAHAAARDAFVFFGIIVAAVALLGCGRVWLSVQAAQASIDSTSLRREIKQERYVGDMLEIQQSALATPSRIQAIAGTTMGMAPAQTVSYLDIRGPKVSVAPVNSTKQASADHSAGLLARVVDVAADEAQALLVGDVGLVSSK